MMSSFRPDPMIRGRGFMPDRFEGESLRPPGFVGTVVEGTERAIPVGSDPSSAEAPEPEPSVVWTPERVEALEREAFERGVASGRKESDALERACAALEAGASGLRHARHERLLAHRALMLDLVAEIATAWIGRQLAVDRELLGRVIEQALERLRPLGPDRLLLCGEDAALLLEAAEERVEHWRSEHALELVEAPSLEPGEFRIEARQGSVDGRLESVRKRVRETLAEALGEETDRAEDDGAGGSAA